MNLNPNQMAQQPPPRNGGFLGANDTYYRNFPMLNNQNYQNSNNGYYQNNQNRNYMNYRQPNYQQMNHPQPNYRQINNRQPNYRQQNYHQMNYRMPYIQRNYRPNPMNQIPQWNNGQMNFNPNNYRIFRNQNRGRQNQSNNRNNIQQRQQQRRSSGRRVLRLNDFMPPELRDESPDSNININSRTTTRPQTPIDALPQRRIFAAPTTITANETQPFELNEQESAAPNHRTTDTTTASYRRRQRRVRQQEYRDMNNRFNVLIDEADQTEPEQEQGNINSSRRQIKFKSLPKVNKKRLYLEHNRIMSYLQKNFASNITSRGNQAYVLAASPIYDEWIRSNYELQVWQAYLKMGTEQQHWAKEVIQRTKKRDQVVCTRFVQKKINQLLAKISQASATISDLQIQLNIYWAQLTSTPAPSTTTTGDNTNNTPSLTATTTTTNRIREPVERLERMILKYIHHCTQHVKRLSENKVKLARAQLDEFKALQDFELVATPLQWNVHLTLKPKMKQWSTKNKNLQIALKRVEYDLPPSFIGKTDFNFKIDESVIGQDEAQELYNQMRQVTKEYRTRAMTVYIQALTREQELLTNEIKQMIEGFPKENDTDRAESQASMCAFKQYQELREKRIALETEQSLYFLEDQRVEGETDNPDQPVIVAPTLTRSLGEDFLLQL